MMNHIDVFNGDADGICALHQLRLSQPLDSKLVTGVKRDINLVSRIRTGEEDSGVRSVTVLDVSLDKNRTALQDVLNSGVSVTYIDHHFPGDIPTHPSLKVHIDTDANTCTGLIVNGLLNGAQRPWAVVAAYGDNLQASARQAAEPLQLGNEELERLKTLGTLLNYNGYGSSVQDLHFAPDELYRRVSPYADPFSFIHEDSAYRELQDGYTSDYDKARSIAAAHDEGNIAIYLFPDAAFSRRISGVYANELAQQNPDKAHALLTELDDGAYLVSVRAPVNNRTGADELCRQFETGGGRKAAAGINRLPADELDRFTAAMTEQYRG